MAAVPVGLVLIQGSHLASSHRTCRFDEEYAAENECAAKDISKGQAFHVNAQTCLIEHLGLSNASSDTLLFSTRKMIKNKT